MNRWTGQYKVQGFTIVELMVVLVIVIILALVAVPSYTGYVQDSRRTEARNALVQTSTLLEQFFSENNTYTTDLTQIGLANAGQNQTERGFYVFEVVAPTAACPIVNCFALTAKPRNGSEQWGDDFWYQLGSDGFQQERICPKDVCSSGWTAGWSH